MRIAIYDTTLRDGSQGEGVNFSLQDKLLITAKLDDLGRRLHRGRLSALQPQGLRVLPGRPQSWPLKHAKVAAFGMTRRKNADADERHLHQGPARRRDPGRHHRRQDVGPARPRHPRHRPRREPADDRRLGRLPARPPAARCSTTPSTSSTASRRTRSTPCARCRPPSGPGRACVILCDTNGGTLPERGRRARCGPSGRRCGATSASTATTTAIWPSPTRWPRSARGRRRCRGRSTASASAAATSTWSASSPTWPSSTATTCCRRAAWRS